MEKPQKHATVVLLEDSLGRIALAPKKQAIHHENGQIEYSLGLLNGYGGKQEDTDPTIFDTAIRELFDESGVRAEKVDLKYVLRADFSIKDKEGNKVPFMTVSFFIVKTWAGDPVEGDEMGVPVFFEKDAIPYDMMMPADKFLFQKIFAGEYGVYSVYLPGKHEAPVIEELKEEL